MSEYPLDLEQHDVRAILSGTKTQLRLILDLQPNAAAKPFMAPDGSWHIADAAGRLTTLNAPWRAGDRIWIREHHATTGGGPIRYLATDDVHELRRVWPPSALSRTFSRLTLVVERIRLEQVASLSQDDVQAEGLEFETADPPFWYYPELWPHALTAVGVEENQPRPAAIAAYGKYFDAHHGQGAFDQNPWVAVLEFSAYQMNVSNAPTSSMREIAACG